VSGRRAAVFELGGGLAPEPSELASGPWTRAPELAAFDAGAGPAESRWRVALAQDDAASRAGLAGGERSVARAHAVLDDAPRRLARALAAVALDPTDLPAPPPGPLERVLLRAGDLARGRARIETHLAGALVARSITSLSGDTELWTAPRLSRAGAALHGRSVAVALRTRHAWARLVALAASCGGRIAALGGPAGVAALPLVWRFLRDVLRDVRDPPLAVTRRSLGTAD
jgi:hypothetical protein